MTAHGGQVDVESSVEHGTAFTVRLPRASGARAEEAQPIGQDGDGAPAAP